MTTEKTPRGSVIPRALGILLGVAAAWVVIQGMQSLAALIVPVFLALNLIIAVHPVGNFLTKKGVPAIVGIILNVLLVLVALVVFFSAIGWAITQLINELPSYGSQFNSLISQTVDRLAKLGISQQQINEWLSKFNFSSLFGVLTQALSSLSSLSALLVAAVATILFFGLDAITIRPRLDVVREGHPYVADALIDFSHSVRTYWLVTTAFGAIVAVIDGFALWMLGVPLPAVWAVLLFLCNYIPNIGFIFAMIPPTLMGLLEQGTYTALAVVLICSAVSMVLQGFVQPRVTGRAVGVNASVSFLSVMFWSWVLGAAGALLSVPMTLFVKELLVDADPKARWLNAFLSDSPKEDV